MKALTLKDFIMQSMIAALYVVLVYTFQFLSFEMVQFRIAECLLILVYFNKKHAIGLTFGTFLANYFLSPYGLIDAVFGTLATILALLLMMAFQKPKIISLLFPALTNGVIIGVLIAVTTGLPLFMTVPWIFGGEAVVTLFLGYPLYYMLERNTDFKELMER